MILPPKPSKFNVRRREMPLARYLNAAAVSDGRTQEIQPSVEYTLGALPLGCTLREIKTPTKLGEG